MSNKASERLVPKLRFPEFLDSGDWCKKQLHEVALFMNEKVALEDLSPERYLSTENLLQDFMGMVPSSTRPLAGSATRFKIDDVLISNIRPYLKKVWVAEIEGGTSNDVIVIRAKKEVTTKYLSHLLKSDLFIEYVMTGAKGVKMPRGDVELIKKFIVATPTKPDEQKKIADCLSSIDNFITAQIKKIEVLKVHKKGLVQQLFPAEDEAVPRLRFPEFRDSGEWGREKLDGKTLKVGSGVTPLGGEANYKRSGRPFVRSQNVGWGYLVLDRIAFIDEATHKASISTEIASGDVLLNITGASIGRSVVADQRVQGGNVNQHVCIIRTKPNELSSSFLNQYLLSAFGQKQIDSFQTGGNRQGLNFSQIRLISIPLPKNIKEQQKIADVLFSVDNFITTHSKKLDSLNSLKKGLMQELFPSTIEREI